jgi:hypothetical protein
MILRRVFVVVGLSRLVCKGLLLVVNWAQNW